MPIAFPHRPPLLIAVICCSLLTIVAFVGGTTGGGAANSPTSSSAPAEDTNAQPPAADTTSDPMIDGEQWKGLCKALEQNVQQVIIELDQIGDNNFGTEEIIKKINELKHFSMKLANCLPTDKKNRILLAPLFMMHARVIARFSHNFLIGTDGLDDELIRERLRNGITLIKTRAVQLHKLIETMYVEWKMWAMTRAVQLHKLIETMSVELKMWAMFANFERVESPPPSIGAVNALVDQLTQKIDEMGNMVSAQHSNNPTYYNGTSFDEARSKLRIMTPLINSENVDNSQFKIDQLWQIVSKLFVTSTLDMLDNVVQDLFNAHNNASSFFGMPFLMQFADEIDVADEMCADTLRTMTEQGQIKNQFKQRRTRANKLFQDSRKAIRKQMEAIGKKLTDGIAGLQIEKGISIKRGKLIKTLQKVHNLFAIVYNELNMMDLMGSSSMMKKQINEVRHIIETIGAKNTDEDGMLIDEANDDDDVQLTDEIVSCLNVEQIVERIGQEQEELDYKILF